MDFQALRVTLRRAIRYMVVALFCLNLLLIYIDSESLVYIVAFMFPIMFVLWGLMISDLFHFAYALHKLRHANDIEYTQPSFFSNTLTPYYIALACITLIPAFILDNLSLLDPNTHFEGYVVILIFNSILAWFFIFIKPGIRYYIRWKQQ